MLSPRISSDHVIAGDANFDDGIRVMIRGRPALAGTRDAYNWDGVQLVRLASHKPTDRHA
jgi:hypothetical protein